MDGVRNFALHAPGKRCTVYVFESVRMETELESLGIQGFRASGVYAGIRARNMSDMGLIVADEPCVAVGVATTNQVKAAPVLGNLKRLRSGKARAILVNAGNANAATGLQGVKNVELLSSTLAAQLDCPPNEILSASTGVIGVQLPVEKMMNALPGLVKTLSPSGLPDVARSILTTDRYTKVASDTFTLGKQQVRISAMGKGAGMICPTMATMLVFVMTDVAISRPCAQSALRTAIGPTFNSLTVDGDMSTNDTVLMLSNGLAGNTPIQKPGRYHGTFTKALTGVLEHIGKLMVMDGEGATKCVRIEVGGARTERDAKRVARQIANSPLVKTAFFGEDANWGRIVGAAGAAGVKFDPLKVSVDFNDVAVVRNGLGVPDNTVEERATAVMKNPEFTIRLNLHSGRASAAMFTSDLGYEYIKINGSYRS